MLLTDRILDACARLRDGSIRSEQAVSQSVVLPILDALGWPRSDPRFVVPEYSVGNGRVDFALLTHGRAAVFVEVKQPGMAGQADRQLFQYAYHEGIQIAVLTDGKTWHVYGPGLRGTYDERKVCRVDLLNQSPEDSAEHLRRYLDREAVDSEQAEENVRTDYKRLRERRIARGELGKAWASLAAEPSLADLLAVEVESVCGFRPDMADVAAFLASLRPSSNGIPAPPARTPETPAPVHEPRPATGTPSVAGSWTGKSVTLPPGTELQARYKGKTLVAQVEGGRIVYDGQGYATPSAAGVAATGRGRSVNGWIFWEVKRPGDSGWTLLSDLRR